MQWVLITIINYDGPLWKYQIKILPYFFCKYENGKDFEFDCRRLNVP